MRLTVSFDGLDAHRRRMGATLREWRVDINAPPLVGIRHEPRDWEITDLSQLAVGPGDTITIEDRRVFLYIREFGVNADSFDEAAENPDRLRRFHIAWCQKLREMQAAGRFERYVASDRVDDPFGIAVRLQAGEWASGDAELHVCRFCLSHTNWQGYQAAPSKRRTALVTGFSRRVFLATEATHFAAVPSTTDKSTPTMGYAADWADRSRTYRELRAWRCEDCGVDCSNNRALLDAHHQNGVTGDNRLSNLRALCKTCHATRHPNWYRVSSAQIATLDRLRTDQRAGR